MKPLERKRTPATGSPFKAEVRIDNPASVAVREVTSSTRSRYVRPMGAFTQNGACPVPPGPKVAARRAELFTLVERARPATVRQIYYLAVVAGVVEKTHPAYKRVSDDLAVMRRDGSLPFAWIVDNARSRHELQTFTGVDHALEELARYYRRDLTAESEWRVEVWCESDSIAGALMSVVNEFDVPLCPIRGQCSLSFAHEAAELWNADGRDVAVIYVGDLDLAGIEIEESLVDKLRDWVEPTLWFRRIGVTPEQADEFGLPGDPIANASEKKKQKAEALAFCYDREVQAEALDPVELRRVLRFWIEKFVDDDQLAALHEAETVERAQLRQIAADWNEAGR